MAQHPRPVGPTTNAAATFQPAMVQGSRPDAAYDLRSARLALARRAGWLTSQLTHTQAAFVPAMAQGALPMRPRRFLAPRFLHPLAQTTHAAATFSPDMVAGVTAPSAVSRRRQAGDITVALDAPVFAFGMLVGSLVAQPRTSAVPGRKMWVSAQTSPVAAALGPDMVQGWSPTRPRPFLAPRIPSWVVPVYVDTPLNTAARWELRADGIVSTRTELSADGIVVSRLAVTSDGIVLTRTVISADGVVVGRTELDTDGIALGEES
jgi:hypothetical protein